MRGEGDAATALVSRALAEGGPAGYVRSFLDAPRPVAVAIAALAASGGDGAAAATARRLAARAEAQGTGTGGGLLSPRERRVLQLLCLGFTNRELADRLFVSENTVKTHLKSVYGKIGARNRAEAAVRAQALGLGPEEGTE
jgi:LuxR family transcriptional regulator, maltose regulon positive regulatory protein